MIRFGIPVFDSNNKKRGILILNYLGARIINQLNQYYQFRTPHEENENLFLVNQNGYWFNHPDPKKNWGFMYDHKKNITFKNEFPDAWKIISQNDNGQFWKNNSLFTFSTISPIVSFNHIIFPLNKTKKKNINEFHHWKFITYSSKKSISTIKSSIIKKYLIINGSYFLFAIIISWLLSNTIIKRLKMEKEMMVAKKEAEKANIVKSEFLAHMSHELRTPLNGIIGFSQIIKMIKEPIDIIKLQNYADYIGSSGNHLLDMINDILDLSKIESNKFVINKKEFSIIKLINNTTKIIEPMILKKKLTLEKNLADDIDKILGDELRIKQILFNLLSNAIKFTESGKKIGITAKGIDNYIIIEIWDQGIGIEKDNIEKIFESFVQIHNDDHTIKGTGLGLPIVKKLIEIHDGSINLESTVGSGSRFIVTLPGRIK